MNVANYLTFISFLIPVQKYTHTPLIQFRSQDNKKENSLCQSVFFLQKKQRGKKNYHKMRINKFYLVNNLYQKQSNVSENVDVYDRKKILIIKKF